MLAQRGGRRQGSGESDPFSRAPPRHVSAPKKDCPRTEVLSAQSASNALRRAQETRSADRFRSHGGSVQDSSNPTLEEVRNALGRARWPSHSILPRSRAEQSLRASLDTARTNLQGGGYDSRQCRADTQLAMIGVSMRVTLSFIIIDPAGMVPLVALRGTKRPGSSRASPSPADHTSDGIRGAG